MDKVGCALLVSPLSPSLSLISRFFGGSVVTVPLQERDAPVIYACGMSYSRCSARWFASHASLSLPTRRAVQPF